MKEACIAFDTPVTGGNVSFYNESPNYAVYPTPTIGMLGIIENLKHVTSASFKNVDDSIILLGNNLGDISGSEFLSMEYNLVTGDTPHFNLAFEVRLQQCALEIIQSGLISSAHDISDGGLVVSLLESSLLSSKNFGFEIQLDDSKIPLYKLLFGEEQSRIVVSANSENLKHISSTCEKYNVPMTVLGRVIKENIGRINNHLEISLEKVSDLYFNTIHKKISADTAR